MKIRFTETRVVDDHRKGTADELRFEEGKEYNLDDDAARRWIARGIAAEVDRKSQSAPAEVSPRSGAARGRRSYSRPKAKA